MKFFKKFFKKNEEKLNIMEDEAGHRLPYAFRPASEPGKPLLVMLHGNGNNKSPSKFASPDYNVLLPLDKYGIKNNGCWFLGENGDFFMLRMLETLISTLLSRNAAENRLFFWGSSMGATAALLLALRMEAQAAFCHIPQTNLYDSHWYAKNHVFIDHIFGDDQKKHPWRNLVQLAREHQGKMPLLFISFNRFDRPFYLDEHLWPLIHALNKKGANYFLQIHPQEGHAIHQTAAEHVANFKTYAKEIAANDQQNINSTDC